jgi:DNA polymerase
LIVTYKVDDGPVLIWEAWRDPMPDSFRTVLENESTLLVAHNSNFDRNVLKYALGWETSIERHRCTRAQAYAHGMPGALETLGQVLGLPYDQQKLHDGARLIQTFCIPHDGKFTEPHERPEDWALFCRYAIRDTEALYEIHKRLPQHNYQGENLETFHLDQRINQRGFKIDAPFARAAIAALARAKDRNDRDVSEATAGVVTAVTQRARLLNFLNEKFAAQLGDMKAATIRDMLECDDLDPGLRFLLESRLEGAKSASAKYKRGLQVMGEGDRVRQWAQFCGAGRTGRWSAKGMQPHNCPRPMWLVRKQDGTTENAPVKAKVIDEFLMPAILDGSIVDNRLAYGNTFEACGMSIRHTFIAAEGCEFICADLSSIEPRDISWVANEEWKLALFRAIDAGESADLYKTGFAENYGGTVESVNDNERQVQKVTELSMGFHGGVGAFVPMAAGYNIDLGILPPMVLPAAPEALLEKADKAWRRAFLTGEDYGLERDVYMACDIIKQRYRLANSEIDGMFYEIDRATKNSLRNPGVAYQAARCLIWSNDKYLIIQLPSGRRLYYASPKLHQERRVDPLTGKESTSAYISYLTARGKGWYRQRAWAGLFLENIVQASANDILRDGLRAVHADSLTVPAIRDYLTGTLDADSRTAIVLHTHDEIVLEVPVGSYSVERLIEVMTTASGRWAKGLPIAAEGWHHNRYGKRG